MTIAKLTRLAKEGAMGTPAAGDVIYIGRPKWSVAHHLSATGVPSPFKVSAMERLSKRHRIILLAASAGIGLVLAAICFVFLQVQHEVRMLRSTAKPWVAAAAKAKQQEPLPQINKKPIAPQTPAKGAATQMQVTSTNSGTTVVINGEQVPVPENGVIQKTYTNGSSQSTVKIKVNRTTDP